MGALNKPVLKIGVSHSRGRWGSVRWRRHTSPLCRGRLLSPNPGGTVAGASSPSSSVVPSVVAVPARHAWGDMAAALGCWYGGGQAHQGPRSCLKMPEVRVCVPLQNSWPHRPPAMLPVVQEHCLQALVVCTLMYQEECAGSTACFHL